MQSIRSVSFWVGLLVAGGLLAIAFLAFKTSNMGQFSSSRSYRVEASFSDISGLKNNARVSMAGVQIGRVSHIDLNIANAQAIVTMEISHDYDTLPEDSTAEILTAGLLGEKYIGISPGASDTYLEDGSAILFTSSSVVIERLIQQFVAQMGQ